MAQKEIIEFSNTDSHASVAMEPVIRELLEENPDVSYARINYDEEPALTSLLISSLPPTVSPFFVSFQNGKAVGSVSGIVSKEELNRIIN